ncbi:hypothetical protein [Cohnella abietis]|uniref:Exosporium leader peptide n=1 Tax=Cohnella abietis TaxID=2507935 RepID=A0A3T1D7K1_9BACL|nr:hypothetical protein [Cohnella abietis]BBI34048.1 hypothetical protein KCTCHS21_34470 [Cohnella abietis]
MSTFLDARTSQNASAYASILIPFPAVDTSVLIGVIGLQVINPTGVIRTQFSGIIGLAFPIPGSGPTDIEISVVRGSASTDLEVFALKRTFNVGDTGIQVLNFSGADYNVPPPVSQQLVYSMFVSSSTLIPIRNGPESFLGAVYCD